jgi:hypothetical protein
VNVVKQSTKAKARHAGLVAAVVLLAATGVTGCDSAKDVPAAATATAASASASAQTPDVNGPEIQDKLKAGAKLSSEHLAGEHFVAQHYKDFTFSNRKLHFDGDQGLVVTPQTKQGVQSVFAKEPLTLVEQTTRSKKGEVLGGSRYFYGDELNWKGSQTLEGDKVVECEFATKLEPIPLHAPVDARGTVADYEVRDGCKADGKVLRKGRKLWAVIKGDTGTPFFCVGDVTVEPKDGDEFMDCISISDDKSLGDKALILSRPNSKAAWMRLTGTYQ